MAEELEPRPLLPILNRMIAEIPLGRDDAFENRLRGIRDSVSYSAPENMTMWWREASLALNEHFGDPKKITGWQQRVANIFMGKHQKVT